MKSSAVPIPSVVLDDLGAELLELFDRATVSAGEDYAEYRQSHPGWVVDNTERTLAGWIHDRIWAHLRTLLESRTDVRLIDNEPTREIRVARDCEYVIRVKRHGEMDAIHSYPTKTALRFWGEPPALPGFEEIHLALGYRWDADVRAMGETVISYRTTMGKTQWAEAIESRAEGTSVSPLHSVPSAPVPSLDLSSVITHEGEDAGSSAS